MKKLAIAVGIDSYTARPLKYCVADAEAVATTLEMPEYGYSVIRLFDEQATRFGILAALSDALEYQPDQFVFYFSGHGAATPVGTYLVSHDARPHDEGVELATLSRYMERQSEVTAQVVAILDCCHAGAALPWDNARFVLPSDIEQGISTLTDTRVVVAACRADEFSYEEDSVRHGLFTYHVIEGLTGNAVNFNGDVTVGSLYDYVGPEIVRAGNQKPLLRGDVGGRVVLGSGFPQRVGAPVPAEVRRALLDEGQQLLDEYAELTARTQARWKESGHRECSQALTGIVRWFQTKSQQHPELTNDQKFRLLMQAISNQISQLGSMDAGTRVGRGVLAHKLGSGGFGTVWRVDPTNGDSQLALKVFHPADFGEKDKLELFHRGYRAMSRLDHPRVVSVYEYNSAPVGFYMEFIDGPNLRQIPELITDAASLLQVLIMTAETIQHAHGRGVVHRDIKPENILLSYQDELQTWWPHLTDFDLAWFSTATSVTEKSFGNLYYAAPEQLAKPHSRLARSPLVDIFAFGQLAFYALTGSNPTPFATDQNIGVLRERIGGWQSGTAAHRVIDWYQKCVMEDPARRYQDFQALIADLAAAEVAARAQSLDMALDASGFIQEIAFGLSGFKSKGFAGDEVVRSLSGRTAMEFSLADAPPSLPDSSARHTFSVILMLDVLEIQGVTSERAKTILLSRVNEIVGKFANVSRRSKPAAGGGFAVEVIFSPIATDYSAVLFVRDVLGSIIDSLER